VGRAYETKKLTRQDDTFIRQAARALRETTLESATAVIDRWYKANPSQLNKPVLAVVWSQIAKPKLPAEEDSRY
jgi:hypothetical protein